MPFPNITPIEKIEHALRAERDALRAAGDTTAANAINTEEMISMDKDPPMIPVTVVTNISHERMVDLIVGAFEGGSTSWLDRAASLFLPQVPGIEFNNPAYSDTRFWRAGGQMLLTYDNPGNGPNQLTKTVRNIELIQGLQIMAQQYPRHFADFMQENDDADTADVFMQCVVLGEVVYG